MTHQGDINAAGAAAQDAAVARQVAALCYRAWDNGRVEVLLVTSRRTGRWILPKGWPMPGRSNAEAAAQEAWEEAGVRGRVRDRILGQFLYRKIRPAAPPLTCLVEVYPLCVSDQAARFPECDQRKRLWMPVLQAAQQVAEPELARLIHHFEAPAAPHP